MAEGVASLAYADAEELLQQPNVSDFDGDDEGDILGIIDQTARLAPLADPCNQVGGALSVAWKTSDASRRWAPMIGPYAGWASSSLVRPRLVTL